MAASKYIGIDFRGRPLTPENVGQFLIDYAEYNKAASDFNIGFRPYWETTTGGSLGIPLRKTKTYTQPPISGGQALLLKTETRQDMTLLVMFLALRNICGQKV